MTKKEAIDELYEYVVHDYIQSIDFGLGKGILKANCNNAVLYCKILSLVKTIEIRMKRKEFRMRNKK